jgi:hypothetical protein
MSIRRFLLDLYHMRYAFTKTCTPNSCALHRKQQSVMLFLNKLRKNACARVVSLRTQNESRGVLCRLFIVYRQKHCNWTNYPVVSYLFLQVKAVCCAAILRYVTDNWDRIPILNWSCSFIVGYRRKAMLLYLNSTSAILVLCTGIGIFLWCNTK